MSELLRLEGVGVTYRSATVPALVDASFSVSSGEVVLIAGPSGCGKSTLLRVLNGLVPRSYRAEVTGRIEVEGRDAAPLALRDISEVVGTLLQDPAKQVVGHSVLAEIAFGLENRGTPPSEIRERAHRVAERLGLTALLSTPPHELSGGQLQLVAFAGILVLDPKVIVIDEPLANLDPDAADVLLAAVRSYVDGGGAAVIVEHRVDEVLALAPDRVVYLEEGGVVYSGDVDGFLEVASPESVKLPFSALLASASGEEEALPESTPIAPGAAARLHFEGAELGYGARTIVSAVERRFEAGERVAILGRNGAGKSTLMRAAVGLVAPTRGRVLLDARPVHELSAAELVSTCGYLFQNPGQALFSENVGAELAFGPRNLGVPEEEIPAISDAALRAVSLHDVPGILERPPRTLSFGQQRRLAVALALTLRPRTLILDEPTAGQDERSSRHFLDAVWAIEGIDSVYFITHDVDMALARADRVVVVDGGGIVADATPAEIVHDLELWHEPGEAAGGRAVLRGTDFVRAAREHGPAAGRLPRPLDLARRLRLSLDAPHSLDAPPHPLERTHP
ncbi:ABC transporter ATP-binding protein [Rathayibacter sp. SD072]|uniref:ABC transporter ATP-binding protein n=1 Tax=Rathayibacter sp. SD072 TaxID=2781731 RepID=UPI001A9581E3|nr:ABC transporter ATP-binding protein [Rathayibacter sp. SD072]MBO0983282.1 ABC transporter ATP-binding protein [Rathayibacter sp. SD072]